MKTPLSRANERTANQKFLTLEVYHGGIPMTPEEMTGEVLALIPPFDTDLARRAYAHLSHTPEERAQGEEKSFRFHLYETVELAMRKAETTAQRNELRSAVVDYAKGYQQRLYAVLNARSRTASSFITGGANFPTRRNQKALDVESRREDDLRKYTRIGRTKIADRVAALETPEQKSATIIRRMVKQVEGDLATIAAIERGEMPGFEAKTFVSSTSSVVRGLYKQGFRAECNAVLDFIEQQRAALKINAFAKSTIWNLRTEDK